MTARLLPPTDDGIAEAAALLRAGGLVALPTETVYGLAADATSTRAVTAVFAAKRRPADNPLIVHVADVAALGDVAAEVTPLAAALAAAFWPGPLTVVLAARPELPRATTGGLSTVAVRTPDHPVTRAVIRAAGVPLAAPSANRSGRPSPTTAAHVLADLGEDLDAVLDGGPCPVGVESTVVDARGDAAVVLREGAVTHEDLRAAGFDVTVGGAGVASPGTRYRHYRPRCAVVVAAVGDGPRVAAELQADGRRVGLVAPGDAPHGVLAVARVRDATELAEALYGALRAAEDAGLDTVVVEAVEEVGVGRAVMDRLRRAAG